MVIDSKLKSVEKKGAGQHSTPAFQIIFSVQCERHEGNELVSDQELSRDEQRSVKAPQIGSREATTTARRRSSTGEQEIKTGRRYVSAHRRLDTAAKVSGRDIE